MRSIRVMDKDVRLIYIQFLFQREKCVCSFSHAFCFLGVTCLAAHALHICCCCTHVNARTYKHNQIGQHKYAYDLNAIYEHMQSSLSVTSAHNTTDYKNWHDKTAGCPLGGAVWESALAVVDQLLMRSSTIIKLQSDLEYCTIARWSFSPALEQHILIFILPFVYTVFGAHHLQKSHDKRPRRTGTRVIIETNASS